MNAYDLDSPLRLRDWLASCNHLYELRHLDGSAPVWMRVASGDPQPFCPPPAPPAVSPKSFFFSEREELYRFLPPSDDQPGAFIASLPVLESTVLFGVHPCDLTAIGYMDQVFAEDQHYQIRRRSTLLVGFDCARSCEGGFCSLVDAGPGVHHDLADLVLIPAGDGWVLLSESPAGDEAVRALQLTESTVDWPRLRQQRQNQVAEEQGDDQWLRNGIEAVQDPQRMLPVLRELATRCFGCSGCSMSCPTCSCFAPRPRSLPDGGMLQERVWDSCLFEGFQREAGGYNPMAAPELRILRFWQHKFGAGFYKQAGRHGCVGCGRCDRVCPGAIGVRTVMTRGGAS